MKERYTKPELELIKLDVLKTTVATISGGSGDGTDVDASALD